jgi:hypothetical protein
MRRNGRCNPHPNLETLLIASRTASVSVFYCDKFRARPKLPDQNTRVNFDSLLQSDFHFQLHCIQG